MRMEMESKLLSGNWDGTSKVARERKNATLRCPRSVFFFANPLARTLDLVSNRNEPGTARNLTE